MSEETKVLRCKGETNDKTRCDRKKEVPKSKPEWYCWQHQYQKHEHPFELPNTLNYELDGKLRHLAKRILENIEDLADVREGIGIKNIGFIRSYKEKKKSGKRVFADCKKITGPERAIIPYRFLITFYDPNVVELSLNQRKIVMYHELRHIGPNDSIVPHDVEDFKDILEEFGLDYLEHGKQVPDILADDYRREVV